jgi:hypothetical protein
MDTPAPQHDPGLESRVFRLENDMTGVRESLARIEAVLPHLATAAQVADLRAELGAELGGQIAELRGRMDHLPTTWQMMTGIVAGQCTLAALLAAIVFGVLKVTGHG